MKKLIPKFIIATGMILIGIAAFMEISTRYNQKKLMVEYIEYNDYMEQYIQTMKDIEQSEIEAEAAVSLTLNEGFLEKNIETNIETFTNTDEQIISDEIVKEKPKFNLSKILEGKTISGILEIPKINVNSAILEGTDDSALKYTVGHYPGLGEVGKGNYVLLGHRNYVYGHFFRDLDQLIEGDEVLITKDGEKYTYMVYESFVVKPEDVWVLNQTEEPIITMITCTPIGTYTERLIVRASLKE